MDQRYDVVAFGAHPDDLEVVMGGTAAKLASRGQSILFVDLCDGEPARHAATGRAAGAGGAAPPRSSACSARRSRFRIA